MTYYSKSVVNVCKREGMCTRERGELCGCKREIERVIKCIREMLGMC